MLNYKTEALKQYKNKMAGHHQHIFRLQLCKNAFQKEGVFFFEKYPFFSKFANFSKFRNFRIFAKTQIFGGEKDFFREIISFYTLLPPFPDFEKINLKKPKFWTHLRNLTIPAMFYGKFAIIWLCHQYI